MERQVQIHLQDLGREVGDTTLQQDDPAARAYPLHLVVKPMRTRT